MSCACKDVFRAYGSCHRFAVPTVLLQPDDHDQVITMQFAWDGNLKPVSTSFIGVRYAGIAILVSVGLEDCNRSVTCVFDVRVVQSGVRVCAVHAVLPGKRGANGLYRGSVQHHCAVPQDSGWTNRHLFSRGPALETRAWALCGLSEFVGLCQLKRQPFHGNKGSRHGTPIAAF